MIRRALVVRPNGRHPSLWRRGRRMRVAQLTRFDFAAVLADGWMLEGVVTKKGYAAVDVSKVFGVFRIVKRMKCTFEVAAEARRILESLQDAEKKTWELIRQGEGKLWGEAPMRM